MTAKVKALVQAVDVDLLIGRRLRSRRRLLGLTLRQVAELCGSSFQTIHKYEAGIASISVSRLWALSQALHVDPGYFFEGLGEADPNPLKNTG